MALRTGGRCCVTAFREEDKPGSPAAAALGTVSAGAGAYDPFVNRGLTLDHLVVAVSNWERSNAFYRDVLGAELVELPRGRFAYRFGDQQLNVYGPGSESSILPAEPVGVGNSDLCFAWSGSIGEAVAHLEHHDVEIAEGPVPRQGARGEGTSVYFYDPDGSLLEFISYA